MADPKHLKRLLESLARPSGRKEWLAFKLKFAWIDLSTADFTDQSFANYDLSEVNLSAAIFLGANLAGDDLSDSRLAYADLRRACLRNTLLDRANLSGANLQGADLVDACLEHALLPKCRMMEANLTGVDLSNADLTGADLRGASLKYARMNGAKLKGANVAGADLTGAVMDDSAPAELLNFAQAFVDDRKYREMRSLLVTGSRELVTGSPSTPPPPPPPQPEPPKAKAAASEEHPTKKKKKKPRPAAAPTPRATPPPQATPGPLRFEDGIPVRDREPDLTSIDACCRVLEVPLGATTEEIAKAFRQKAKLYHPDKVRHLSDRVQQLASDEFQRVFRAYEMLTRRTTRPLVGIRWAEGVPYRETPYDYTIEEYEKLAMVNPNHSAILYNLAWKYFEAARYQESIQGFQRLIEIDPKDEDASYNLMIVRLFVELQLPYDKTAAQ
jgi:uncharacterized protein YjbI with pentapeptide repeats